MNYSEQLEVNSWIKEISSAELDFLLYSFAVENLNEWLEFAKERKEYLSEDVPF